MKNEQTKYILVPSGSDHPILYGSMSEVCEAWCRKRYQDAPDEKFSVFEVKIVLKKELTKNEIEEIVDEYYEEMNK